MEIVIMKDNWEEFKKGNTKYLRALKREEIKYFKLLHESLIELNVVERKKPALADEYTNYVTPWLNTAYNFINLPQKMILNWLSAVNELRK
jgi:hypothetical protein